jgi:riboflavin synthase alpha subunit
MFTGLIREVGTLRAVRHTGGLVHLEIEALRCAPGLSVGDSLAVNGVCLTVTRAAPSRVSVDVSRETLRVTTVGEWRAGARLHLEPALRAGDPLGGHFVLGHVDGVGRVIRFARRGGTALLTIDANPALLSQLLPKGSIAVDGVSLTLDQGPFDRSFTLTLIPHTLRQTRFEGIRPGERVNLELDVLAKAGARANAADHVPATRGPGEPLTLKTILGYGFSSRAAPLQAAARAFHGTNHGR